MFLWRPLQRVNDTLLLAREQPFARGSIILTITAGISYALGLLRDRMLAATFGASDPLDAYQASFIVPDLLFNAFVAGGLTAAFIPVFTDLRTRHRNQEATRLAGTLLTAGVAILIVVGLLIFLLARPLTTLVAPGFTTAKHDLLINLTRIMLLSPLLFFVSNLLGGMLVSAKHFLFYGISPALYNLGIIAGILLFAPTLGIYSAALGTLLGALLHLLARLIDLRRADLHLIPSTSLSPALRKVIVLMLPRVVGLTAVQMQLWAFTAIASTRGEGAVTIVNLARNFQSFPVSLIGISFATSLFPLLAESASRRARSQYLQQLTKGMLTTLAVVVPATLAMYILRRPIISVLIGTGQFDAAAIARTAAVLGIYTLSIPTESINHLLSRAFYALHNTLIPVTISIVSIAASVGTAYLFAPTIDVAGIPAAFAVGTTLQTLLLAALLHPQIRHWFTRPAK